MIKKSKTKIINMNTIQSLDNVGGNLLTKKYYKFDETNNYCMCDLTNEDYNTEIITSNKINITFPLGINGIISPVYSYTSETGTFNLKNIIAIMNTYYSKEITHEEMEILTDQSDDDDDLSIYSYRKDLLDYSNLCYFQGIKECDGVYTILLGT